MTEVILILHFETYINISDRSWVFFLFVSEVESFFIGKSVTSLRSTTNKLCVLIKVYHMCSLSGGTIFIMRAHFTPNTQPFWRNRIEQWFVRTSVLCLHSCFCAHIEKSWDSCLVHLYSHKKSKIEIWWQDLTLRCRIDDLLDSRPDLKINCIRNSYSIFLRSTLFLYCHFTAQIFRISKALSPKVNFYPGTWPLRKDDEYCFTVAERLGEVEADNPIICTKVVFIKRQQHHPWPWRCLLYSP